LLLTLASVVVFGRENRVIPTIKPLGSVPASLGDWKMVSDEVFGENILKNLSPTDYLSRTYRDPKGRYASVYVGYHDGGKSGAIHSPRLCLPGSGWNSVVERESVLKTASGEIPLVYAIYQKGDQSRLFLYWFRVAGENISNPFELKARELLSSLTERRKDTVLIRVDVPIYLSEEDSLSIASGFIDSLYPELDAILPGSGI
jgi:EpsI family protein